MNVKKHYIITGLLALIGSPLAVSIGLIALLYIELLMPLPFRIPENLKYFPAVLPGILLAAIWFFYSKKAKLPEKASQLFLPVFAAFCYYMLVWIILSGLSGYNINSPLFSEPYLALTSPYIVIIILLAIEGKALLFPIINSGITIITVLVIIVTCKIAKKKIVPDRKVFILCLAIIVISVACIFQFTKRDVKFLSGDYQTERIEDEVDLSRYHPFSAYDILQKLSEPAAIEFTEDYPKLDGATAAYPVYAAIAQELYKGLDYKTVEEYVQCSNTGRAYERLINGEIDIFFGAQPSKQQTAAAKEKGVEFTLIPVAKEAFVFMVNKDNPINSLTLEQIQDIYQKKITNWREVGGKAEKIIPFQRPENSGSQTIMIARVMGDKPLAPPLREEYSEVMGGVINRVAAYRNYSSAIGYSFRFFAGGMKPNENIRLLAINKIEPSVENIRNGIYPFTVDVYVITAKGAGSSNENTEILIQWILSEQGQGFVETCGYARN